MISETSSNKPSPKPHTSDSSTAPLKDKQFTDYFILIHFKTCPSALKENEQEKPSQDNVYDFKYTNPPLSDICWMVIDAHKGNKAFPHEKTHHWLKPPQGKISAQSQVSTYQNAIQQLADFIQENIIAAKKSFRFVTETENHISYMILKSSQRSHFPKVIWTNTGHVLSLKMECERYLDNNNFPYNRFDMESVFSMLKILRLKSKMKMNPTSRDICNGMCSVLSKMVHNKHKFVFSPPVLSKTSSSSKPSPQVVRLRGLPWEAQENDIRDFFEGLSIADDGVLVLLNFHGRSTGEAFVEFTTEKEGAKAIDYDRQFMAHRYIEVFPSNTSELKSARQFREEQEEQWDSTVIRLRGLPFSSTLDDILTFFSGFDVGADEVVVVQYRDGRLSGDAFVELSSAEQARAAMKLHKQPIGNRYIELFKSSEWEREIVMANALYFGVAAPPPIYNALYLNNFHYYMNHRHQNNSNYTDNNNMFYYPYQYQLQQQYPYPYQFQPHYRKNSHRSMSPESNGSSSTENTDNDEHDLFSASVASSPPFYSQQFSEHVIRVSGLPNHYNEHDVAHMFHHLNIAPFGVHLIIDDEHPSGEAFIELVTAEDVRKGLASSEFDIPHVTVHKSSKHDMMAMYHHNPSSALSKDVNLNQSNNTTNTTNNNYDNYDNSSNTDEDENNISYRSNENETQDNLNGEAESFSEEHQQQHRYLNTHHDNNQYTPFSFITTPQ